jgi:hypothetical protein
VSEWSNRFGSARDNVSRVKQPRQTHCFPLDTLSRAGPNLLLPSDTVNDIPVTVFVKGSNFRWSKKSKNFAIVLFIVILDSSISRIKFMNTIKICINLIILQFIISQLYPMKIKGKYENKFVFNGKIFTFFRPTKIAIMKYFK